MSSIISEDEINGYILNKKSRWSYTITDFYEYNQFKQFKQMKKEQKERESQEKLNMIYTQSPVQVPVQVQKPYFIGTDIYGFNHYSTINSSGILIYYYIDNSGLYHYYN